MLTIVLRDRSETLESFRHQYSLPLDREIAFAVMVLQAGGIETYESCVGGEGHAFPEPTVRFYGGTDAGLRAVAIALASGLPVFNLRRFWTVRDGELIGPDWEMTFFPVEKLIEAQERAGWKERSPALTERTGHEVEATGC